MNERNFIVLIVVRGGCHFPKVESVLKIYVKFYVKKIYTRVVTLATNNVCPSQPNRSNGHTVLPPYTPAAQNQNGYFFPPPFYNNHRHNKNNTTWYINIIIKYKLNYILLRYYYSSSFYITISRRKKTYHYYDIELFCIITTW
jgi:hypothetical protein